MQSRYKILLVAGLILVLVGGGFGGYGLWSQSDVSGSFVSTSNAQVAARLVQVGSSNAGRIVSMNVDVGAPVLEGQVVATVDIPTGLSTSATTDTTKLGFRDVQDQLAEVIAPTSGVVSARWANEGDTMPAGQPIVTLIDIREVWVEANVDEGKIGRVSPGQYVEVDVDYLDDKLTGRVETVWPATAASSGTAPDRTTASTPSRVDRVIPVKIVLCDRAYSLIPGSSADIKIWTTQLAQPCPGQ